MDRSYNVTNHTGGRRWPHGIAMNQNNIKLIALDLDGTLLNSKKELTPANAQALAKAAEMGIHIVPTTGRFFGGMPQIIRELPYLRYAITINGAQVSDLKTGDILYRAEIPLAQAVEIMTYLDTLPVIYDCYQENWGYMTRALWDRTEEFAPNGHYVDMIRNLRKPVDELKAYLLEKGKDVQKIQFFVNDPAIRLRELAELDDHFPGIVASSAASNNVEINQRKANKGDAVVALAARLGFGPENVMTFGDGSNDVSMLAVAGFGVAMENGCDEAKSAAKYMTVSCDEDGVAKAIEQFCF